MVPCGTIGMETTHSLDKDFPSFMPSYMSPKSPPQPIVGTAMVPSSETCLIPAASSFFAGNQCLGRNELKQAEHHYRQALESCPDFAEAHANLALVLEQSGQLLAAELHYLRALQCNPYSAQTHTNYASLLVHKKDFDEAEASYQMALALDPASVLAWQNLGVLQASLHRVAEAEESFRTALSLDPQAKTAAHNYGQLLLMLGRYTEGWQLFEARSWYQGIAPRFACPRWQGESLAGRSLLIAFEAGHGDMIQFCRFAEVVKTRGAALVTLLCHPALHRLFRTLSGVDQVLPFTAELPSTPWDYWTPPMSLPHHCRTTLATLPATLPYLHADPEREAYWAARLRQYAASPVLRVGLAWKGNPRFNNDQDRSLPSLGPLAPLWAVDQVAFVSLQKEAPEDGAHLQMAERALAPFGPELADFADTAALITQLDLVIAVDTAVAHLAGALGRPCWLLLPWYRADWRWLQQREDSPWYPEVMRIFRQPAMGDWATPIGQVTEALRCLVRDWIPK